MGKVWNQIIRIPHPHAAAATLTAYMEYYLHFVSGTSFAAVLHASRDVDEWSHLPQLMFADMGQSPFTA